MNKKITITLNHSEVMSLLHIFSSYNVFSIQDRNTRFMVAFLLGKIHLQLIKLSDTGNKNHKIKLTSAQAAAFDVAFVQTPVLVRDYNLNLYDELLVDRIVYAINSQL